MTPKEQIEMGRWQLSLVEKVVGSAVIALLGWVAITTQQTATKVAVIESKLSDVRALTRDRYTKSDHDRYAAEVEKRFIRLEARHGLE